MNVLALLHRYVHKRSAGKRRVCRDSGLVADAVHISRARKHTLYIYAEHRRGEKSHGAQFREPAAYAVGEHVFFELAAEALVNLYKVAAACVGGEYHIAG